MLLFFFVSSSGWATLQQFDVAASMRHEWHESEVPLRDRASQFFVAVDHELFQTIQEAEALHKCAFEQVLSEAELGDGAAVVVAAASGPDASERGSMQQRDN